MAAMPDMDIIKANIQPIELDNFEFFHWPIIFLFRAINMIRIIITGATIPFKTAEYIKALIGFNPIKFIAIPINIDIIITP